MELVLSSARLLVAAVFALAGVAKSLDLAGSRKAAADFGLPVWLAALFGNALPFAELAIAVLLIPAATAWWAAVAPF
jgi:uncharacterized membrane protein YphA (DoxX/SURF4 family)